MKIEGPEIMIEGDCLECKYCDGESYICQGDSGTIVFCTIDNGKRIIGDTRWRTPDWCPYMEESISKKILSLRLRSNNGPAN